MTGKQPTRDEVGDALLTKIIAQDHPEAMEGEKEVSQLEKSVVNKIRAKRASEDQSGKQESRTGD